MYKRFLSIAYVMNIVFQALFSLITPIGLFFLVGWLLVRYASVGEWIYAPLIILGVLAGLVSMVRFVISAMSAYERLESGREFGRTGDTEERDS